MQSITVLKPLRKLGFNFYMRQLEKCDMRERIVGYQLKLIFEEKKYDFSGRYWRP